MNTRDLEVLKKIIDWTVAAAKEQVELAIFNKEPVDPAGKV